jgi:hypothetical protein
LMNSLLGGSLPRRPAAADRVQASQAGANFQEPRAEIEELHAKLAHTPAVIARAALGIIFATAAVATFLNWWLLIR